MAAVALVPLLLALACVLAACGGGSIGGPVPQTGDARSVPSTTAQRAPSASTATAPPPSSPTARAHASAPAADAGRSAPADPRASGGRAAGPASARAPRAAESSPAAPASDRGSPAQPAPAPAPAATPLDEQAQLALTDRVSPAHYFQQGTVTGTFDGTMSLEVRITSKGVLVHFTATVEGGTIVGRGLAVAVIDGSSMPPLRGTATILSGTGRFADIHGRRLKVSGRGRPDGSRARVRLTGAVTY
jgi:hypothetical protein